MIFDFISSPFSGSALLVHPVTEPKATVVDVFLPGPNEVRVNDSRISSMSHISSLVLMN